LISIIGPPAVGKTTLATLLCQDLPAGLIREDWDHNPHLAESYAGGPEARLPSQLYFLRSRAAQLAANTWPAQGLYVSDYGFCQDRIFARQRLGRSDFETYESLADSVERAIHAPDVLVYLDAPCGELLARIARRGRQFEHAMDRAFLESMRQEYRQAVASMRCPVIEIDAGEEDFRQPAARAAAVERVREALTTASGSDAA